MLRWHALGPPFIGSDSGDIAPERLGKVVLGEPQGATLPSYAATDMSIDRCHDAFSTIA
jgi:hypothetical protein